jgi:hypothetical protein
MKLDERDRLREEDPFTDLVARRADIHVIVRRSRFEIDLNRRRDKAVYVDPDDAWGLDVWRSPPSNSMVADSLKLYDRFYRELARCLDPIAARGPFVLFDLHAYNHRREGPNGPSAPARDYPDINVGTGSMDRERWGPVVDTFIGSLNGTDIRGRPLDVRENVCFQGRNLCRWLHERYPETGCGLALEIKKTFMDEWTGELDAEHLDELATAIYNAGPAVVAAAERRR